MPFPFIFVPANTPKTVLRELRRNVVTTLAENGVKREWTRPLFPADLLNEVPTDASEGATTIYCRLDTALFDEKPDPVREKHITADLAQIIWEAFDRKFEVEVFIGNLKLASKTLIEAKVVD